MRRNVRIPGGFGRCPHERRVGGVNSTHQNARTFFREFPMANSASSTRLLYIIGGALVLAAVVAVVKRDTIAGMLLQGSDVSLTGEEARSSPQAAVAIEFIEALRAGNTATLARLATTDQVARVSPDSAQSLMDADMLADLPSDPTELRSKVKSVQTHEDRAVVTFETQANSWFVQLTATDGGWKVSGV
jgi:hypothetical protein